MANKEITEDNVTLDDIAESMPEDAPAVTTEENAPAPVEADDAEITDDEEQTGHDDDEDQEENEEKRREYAPKKRRRKRRHTHVVFGVLLVVFVISVSILAAVYILKISKELFGVGKSDVEMVLDIPMNSSTQDIAEHLYSEGIISDPMLFQIFSKFKGADGTYIAGTHKL